MVTVLLSGAGSGVEDVTPAVLLSMPVLSASGIVRSRTLITVPA